MARVIENPRELILQNAREILLKEGYDKLSMRNLSKACEIALGTIYNYYPTKKDLIVEMMVEYWQDYFRKQKTIVAQDTDLFEKLKDIFEELKFFINNFKSVWLKRELYDNPDYVESGVKKEDIYMERLVQSIETMLTKEFDRLKLDSSLEMSVLAPFIVLNFITIIQMPVLKYETFERVLQELITRK